MRQEVDEVAVAIQARYALLMPGLVINLNRRADRWQRFILSQSGSARSGGLLPVRVKAIDGADSSSGESIPERDVSLQWDSRLNSQFDRRCISNSAMAMTSSERGCAASHLKAWRAIAYLHLKFESLRSVYDSDMTGTPPLPLLDELEKHLAGHDPELLSTITNVFSAGSGPGSACSGSGSDNGWYLIFEDDAHIRPSRVTNNFSLKINQLIAAAEPHWDIIYLGAALPKSAPRFDSKIIKPVAHRKYNTTLGSLRSVNYAWMLHAYLIRGETALKLLQSLPIDKPVDNYIATKLHDGELFGVVCEDALVEQEGYSLQKRALDSDILHSGTGSKDVPRLSEPISTGRVRSKRKSNKH